MLLESIENKICSRFPEMELTLTEMQDSVGYTVYVTYNFGLRVAEMKALLAPLAELVWVVFEERD
jgi:hypothetical protein